MVVAAVPLLIGCAHEAEVVARVRGGPRVHQHAVQRVRVRVLRTVREIGIEGELIGVVDALGDLVVAAKQSHETKALELQREHVRGLANGELFLRAHLLVAARTLVLVVAIEYLGGTEVTERGLNAVNVLRFDLQADVQHGIDRVRFVAALLTLDLTLQIAAEHREQRALVDTCQFVRAHRELHAFNQVANELVTVLLPAQTKVLADPC